MASEKGRVEPEGTVRTEPDTGVTAASPASASPVPQTDDPEVIRREIERTRAEMDTTFDQLSERISPRHLLDELFEFWHGGENPSRGARRTFRETGTRVAETVRDHPVPAALIGAGLAWLMFEDKKPRYRRREEPRMYAGSYVDARTGEPYDDSYGAEWRGGRPLRYDDESEAEPGLMDKAREKLSETGQAIRETVSGMGERAGDLASGTREGMSRIGERMGSRTEGTAMRMRSGYDSGRQSVSRVIEETPLVAGVAALAAGLAAGLLFPETRRENELFGETSDRLKESVKSTGSEMMERAGRIASETAESAAGEARRQGLSPENLGQKVGRVASDVKNAAAASAQREGLGRQELRSVAEKAKETARDETRRQQDELR